MVGVVGLLVIVMAYPRMALGCCSVLERGDVLLSMDRLFGYEGMGAGAFFPWFPWNRVGDEWGVCNPG